MSRIGAHLIVGSEFGKRSIVEVAAIGQVGNSFYSNRDMLQVIVFPSSHSLAKQKPNADKLPRYEPVVPSRKSASDVVA